MSRLHLCLLLVQGSQAFNVCAPKSATTVATARRSAVATAGLLSGDKDAGTVNTSALPAPEKDALIEALGKYSADASDWGSFALTSANSEQWDEVREQWPVLADRSDSELREALSTYLNEKPDLIGGALAGLERTLFMAHPPTLSTQNPQYRDPRSQCSLRRPLAQRF